ncbi:family 20 glycosylhydrolase [Thalassotalea agarivorans]|uniref:beta-N-acetylhexosaminidase n=1 Tax=Thalassotalea agarivorans TaxID=349064 RepID=A0A1I0HW95_THASX|nr:family 20 glycosylhydrolase [Thalassotalea agarivorans]SET87633.1 hexosaminidase [Thalassotalea agarivorans]
MKPIRSFTLLTFLLLLFSCSESSKTPDNDVSTPLSQQMVSAFAQQVQVKYQVLTNRSDDKCTKGAETDTCFQARISFLSNTNFEAQNWKIYFSHMAPIQSSQSEFFDVKHVNGDIHVISPKESFKQFVQGEKAFIDFRAMFWHLSDSDIMPNYILAVEGFEPVVLASTQLKTDPETGLEIIPHVVTISDYETQFKRTENDSTPWLNSESLYYRNKAVNEAQVEVDAQIIPTPEFVALDKKAGQLDLANGVNFSFENVAREDVQAAIERLAYFGIAEQQQGVAVSIKVSSDDNISGAYQVTLNDVGITIIGVDAAGAFYGLQSLAALISIDSAVVPYGQIVDAPRYDFRGVLVDVARNFRSKQFILDLLDQMAAYKLNKLHFHLGDDEGWRLEIPSLPELTEVGAHRCFDPSEQNCLMPQLGAGLDPNAENNGFYSVADYQEILAAASARHIQVIPSLDMPGHARAAIKAMTARYNRYMAAEDEEKATQFLLHDFDDKTKYHSVQFYGDNTINACMESSYDFVTEVMQQVKTIHSEANHPLTRYHIGADETAGAWVESPICKAFLANNDEGIDKPEQLGAYFVERVSTILEELGIEAAGWSDGMHATRVEKMPAIVQANAWDTLFWGGHARVHEMANRKWQIVISSPDALYFDFPYEADPKEHGYYWAGRHTNTEKVFQMMPDNLPVHAEFWLDREDNPYVADDTKSMLAPNVSFLGMQGQLWSENLRSDEMAEHKLFPRAIALAERAWHKPSWAVPYNFQGAKYDQSSGAFTTEKRLQRDNAWHLFAHALGKKELAKLSQSNIQFRLPTVGAIIENGTLKANIAFPGLAIEFKDEANTWKRYTAPIPVSGQVWVRSIDPLSNRKGRTTTVAP